MLAACDPIPQTLTLTGGLSGADTASRFLQPERTLSLSNELDGVVTNASYTGDLEKRVYLFSDPLWRGGFLSGLCNFGPFCYHSQVEMLTLPLPSVSFGTSSTDIAPDPTKWRGVRAYDIGLCSQHTSWAAFGQQLANGIVGELKTKTTQIGNPRLDGIGAANPILRGWETTEFDRIGFRMVFLADEISDLICIGPLECLFRAGCLNTRVELHFDMTLDTTAGAYVEPAVGSGCSRLVSSAPIPNANDPVVSIQNLSVSVTSDDCFGFASPEALASNLTTTFARELPAGLASGLRDALLQPYLPFVRADLPSRRCTCDSECTDGASELPNPFGTGSGARHRCLDGHCGFQLEVDRFEVRPEGLEIVLAEDHDDPQAAVLMDAGRIVSRGGMCDGDRPPRVLSDQPALRGVLWGGGGPGPLGPPPPRWGIRR